jgi:putative ABC transport system ATP-binding protein
MTAMLELHSVSKNYGFGPTEVRALQEIDLSVDRGEMIAVMGPSGSGKTTILTIAGSLEEATSGQVLVNGDDVGSMNSDGRAALRRRSIGYVFQNFNLLPGLTALENVSLPLELNGIVPEMAQHAAREALEGLGIAERADHFPDDLSGGEQQRAAIARAVVGSRRLLLADEPSGALDSVNGEAVMRLLRRVCDSGVAMVVVTHDPQLAAWADRVVFIRDGRIVDHTKQRPGVESLFPEREN